MKVKRCWLLNWGVWHERMDVHKCTEWEIKEETTVFKQTMSSKILIPKPGGSWQLQGPLEMK